jgi:hypothetical protein
MRLPISAPDWRADVSQKSLGRIAAEAHDRSLFGDETPVPWGEPDSPAVVAWEAAGSAVADAVLREQAPADGGQWLRISFLGHVELTGYVTEVTLGGQAAFHVDPPEKLWGGNPMAWREYAATALYSREPIDGESVRKDWEARQARQARLRAYEQQRALEAAAQDSVGDEDDWADGEGS